jgi:bifunctional enzyme CysN/CysC
MDLVGYRQDVFEGIEKEYREFLAQFGAVPERIIPVSAKMGDNIANRSGTMPWYQGPTVLDTLSLFKKETARSEQPLRFPVQDVYKFDARRIIAGRITAGRLKIGDHLVFHRQINELTSARSKRLMSNRFSPEPRRDSLLASLLTNRSLSSEEK